MPSITLAARLIDNFGAALACGMTLRVELQPGSQCGTVSGARNLCSWERCPSSAGGDGRLKLPSKKLLFLLLLLLLPSETCYCHRCR